MTIYKNITKDVVQLLIDHDVLKNGFETQEEALDMSSKMSTVFANLQLLLEGYIKSMVARMEKTERLYKNHIEQTRVMLAMYTNDDEGILKHVDDLALIVSDGDSHIGVQVMRDLEYVLLKYGVVLPRNKPPTIDDARESAKRSVK